MTTKRRWNWVRISTLTGSTVVAARLAGCVLFSGALAWAAAPQTSAVEWGTVSDVIVPQARAYSMSPRSSRRGVQITSIEAQVNIRERAAHTTLDIYLRNPGGQQAEAVLLLPVPDGATLNSFAFDGSASEPTARLLPRAEARSTYDDIVRRLKDPALLEFAGYNLVRSSVFPVLAGGTQHLRLSYDHILEVDGDRVDYFLPRSEALANSVPWTIQVRIEESRPVSMVYSPSHVLVQRRLDKLGKVLQVKSAASTDPGAFRLSYLLEGVGVSASLLAYPDPSLGGGYFLLMAGLPVKAARDERRVLREVTLVIDRSGSMAGEKMDQTLAAALQVIEALEKDESFNIIDYSSQVAMFAPSPVVRTRENVLAARSYLANIRPGGGTNIHDALLASLPQKATQGKLPIVLFLTDGLPTVGLTTEVEIRSMVDVANKGGRRIFTFGVGTDVNVPLLDRISDASRAVGTYVLPGEDVETKVAQVFRRLAGPVLSDLELELRDASGAVTTRALREVLPARLPDLFEGDQLVLLGQYQGQQPLQFRLSGQYLGERRTFGFEFDLSRASTRNAFVPRLWAGRKIAFLVDQIRQAGAAGSGVSLDQLDLFHDPRFRELAEEILQLSTRFGILSEYTSFLATEGTRLDDWSNLALSCRNELNQRAVRERFGESAVNQGRNFNDRKQQANLNYSNAFWNSDSERVSYSNVQQICDRAFFQQDGRWVDSNLIAEGASQEPEETHAFGSPGHSKILNALVKQGRQGLLSLRGDILLEFDGKNILIQNSNNQLPIQDAPVGQENSK